MKMKKLLTIFLSMLLLLQPLTIYAQVGADSEPFSDIEDHWAEETIKKHYEMGMLEGYPDGTFKPDQKMKRAELIALINRYFGFKEEANTNFKDITGGEWYAEDAAKAKYYDYIEDLKLRPEEEATREDVIGMVSLIIDIEEQKAKKQSVNFKDLEELDKADKEKIEKFSQVGYINGYDNNTFKPKEAINRAEIMTIVERTLGYIVRTQEDLDNMPKDVKKVTIINPNIVIENKEIKGDIYISQGAAGKVTIKDTKVTGQIEIAGGSQDNPVVLENVEAKKVVITKSKEKPRVEIKGKSKIDELKTKSETKVEISGKTEIKEVKTQAKTQLKLKEKSEIKDLVTEGKTEVETTKDSTIEKLEAKSKTNITGEGKIKQAYIKDKDVEIENKPEYTEVDNDAGQVDIGGKKVDSKNDDHHTSSKSSGGGSTSSSDSTSPRVSNKISKIEDLASIGRINPKTGEEWKLDDDYIIMNDLDFKLNDSYYDASRTDFGDINGDGNIEALKTELTTSTGWMPIAKTKDSQTIGFSGSFNGNGHTISNLYIERDSDYQGLFRTLESGAVIENMTISEASIKCGSISGTLAGEMNEAEIDSMSILSTTITASNNKQSIGGLAGKSTNTLIKNSTTNNINIKTERIANVIHYVGGLIGQQDGGGILNSSVSNVIIGIDGEEIISRLNNAGGMVGLLLNSNDDKMVHVESCKVENINIDCLEGRHLGGMLGRVRVLNGKEGFEFNNNSVSCVSEEAKVKGCGFLGGFAGSIDGSEATTRKILIENCYSDVNVIRINKSNPDDADNRQGGFAAQILKADIKNCYAAGNVIGYNLSGGFAGDIKESKISSCYSTGEVNGLVGTGGFTGTMIDSTVNCCYAKGKVTGTSLNTGGFAGYIVDDNAAIECVAKDCYALGNVDGVHSVGGFVGVAQNNIAIQSCYALGTVKGQWGLGGLVGQIAKQGTGDFTAQILDSIAFNPSIGEGRSANRIIGYVDTTRINIQLENNYAYRNMTVKEEGKNKSGASNPNSIWGGDLENLSDTKIVPLSNWNFENVWEIKDGADRPTLQDVGNDNGDLTIEASPTFNSMANVKALSLETVSPLTMSPDISSEADGEARDTAEEQPTEDNQLQPKDDTVNKEEVETTETEDKTQDEGEAKEKALEEDTTDVDKETKEGEEEAKASNNNPEAIDDTVKLYMNESIVIEVLKNDKDTDEDVLTIEAYSQGEHGSVTQEGNTLIYTPEEGYLGEDSFTYTINDGKEGTATGTVNITVNELDTDNN